MTNETLRKIIDLHKQAQPEIVDPITWGINEDEDGFTITFQDAKGFSGMIHPQHFCEMVIEALNDPA